MPKSLETLLMFHAPANPPTDLTTQPLLATLKALDASLAALVRHPHILRPLTPPPNLFFAYNRHDKLNGHMGMDKEKEKRKRQGPATIPQPEPIKKKKIKY